MPFKKGNKKGVNMDQQSKDNATEGIVEQAKAIATGLQPVKGVHQTLSEMLYYADVHANHDLPFESLGPEEQGSYISRGQFVLQCIDKMGMMLIPTRDLQAERLADKEGIVATIKAFIKTQSVPKDLETFFPCEELAIRILEGRIK